MCACKYECMLVHVIIYLQGVSLLSLSGSPILFVYEWSGCLELNLEMKGETKGQRIGP